MEKVKILIVFLSIVNLCSAQNTQSVVEKFQGLESLDDSVSYFIGNDIGVNFLNNQIHKLYAGTAFNHGLNNQFQGKELLIPREKGNELIMKKIAEIRGDSSEYKFKAQKIRKFKKLNDYNDSISYFLGSDIANGLKTNGFDVHFEASAFYAGLTDGMTKNQSLIEKEVGERLALKVIEMEKERLEADQKNKYKNKIEKGEAFLNKKSKEKGVVTLPSGLRYKILKKGTGTKPLSTDVVKTHYHGYLIDGEVFDSSVDRGEPTEFPVNAVISGWTEALQLMPVGSKWTLYIPYQLAYGEKGVGASIGPYEILIFDVELIEIKKP